MKKKIISALKADVTTLILVLPMVVFLGDYTWTSWAWIVGILLVLPWLDKLLKPYLWWWLSEYVGITCLTFIPKGGHVILLYWGILTIILILDGLLDMYQYQK